jgi:2-keto-4-pentenoate hydratase/2-oxohepta-3-ene-1,7-dioic acid hydratase in catechol pathway
MMGFRLANIDGRAVLVADDLYFDVEAVSGGELGSDPMAALAVPGKLAELSAALDGHRPTGSVADAEPGPPVPRPQKVFGIGLNYHDHAAEGGMDVPESPLVFTKFPSCLVGPHADVELRSDGVDYEGELVVVIGPGGKDIDPADAWDHVVGLTAGQDVSDRPAQFAAKPPHFDLGKSFDTFGPIGPVVVSVDEVADRDDVHIVTTVNGEVRQDDTTANLIFDVAELISYLSHITTLVTGDLIFTGTPAGIGAASGRFLEDGDVIVTTIDGIGTMTNRCVRVADHRKAGA